MHEGMCCWAQPGKCTVLFVFSGAIPVLPDVQLPSDEEKWQVGLAVVALRDRLDAIAPGASESSPKSKQRLKMYPKHYPSRYISRVRTA